jgi:hypothetical protein
MCDDDIAHKETKPQSWTTLPQKMEIQPLCDVFIVVSFDDRIQVCAKMFFFFFLCGKESSSKPHL